jgi:hypothetical protein
MHMCLLSHSNIVQEAERRGDYLGKTVQVVPHVTGAIQDWITRVAAIPVDDSGEPPDVCIGTSPPSTQGSSEPANTIATCS